MENSAKNNKRRFYRRKPKSSVNSTESSLELKPDNAPKNNNKNSRSNRSNKSNKPSPATINNNSNKETLLKLAYRLVNVKELTLINKNDKVFTYKVTIDNQYHYKLSIPTSASQPLALSTLIINTETQPYSLNTIKNFNSKAKAQADGKLKYSPVFLINYLVNNHGSLLLDLQIYKHYENNKLL